jgi:hypothetical protein
MPKVDIFEAEASANRLPSDFGREAFESRLRWLESRGVLVRWHAVSGKDSWACLNTTVQSAIETQGPECLPIVVVDDSIISVGGYPTAIELMAAVGATVGSDPEFFGIIAVEAAALGAAIASNDFEAFERQWERIQSLGIRHEDATHLVQSTTATAAKVVQDDMRTRVEQFLAFGPHCTPPKTRCACTGV